MIPPLTSDGYLPPYLGGHPTRSHGMAPFKTTVMELATTFATTTDRRVAFAGLLEFRQMLRSEGFENGFQWIDGSYVEACEYIRGRPPKDIDVVTFFRRPKRLRKQEDWHAFFHSTFKALFDRHSVRSKTCCDVYYEDLDLPSDVLVARARYWFGLLSHQRSSGLWKGLLEIPLTSDDSDAWDWVNLRHTK